MNMQQMIAQAQKMQREIRKAKDALHQKEFVEARAGLVTVTMLGSKEVKSIVINEEGFEKDNKEMVEDLLAACINALIEKIDEEEEAIEEAITGQKGGMGF